MLSMKSICLKWSSDDGVFFRSRMQYVINDRSVAREPGALGIYSAKHLVPSVRLHEMQDASNMCACIHKQAERND